MAITRMGFNRNPYLGVFSLCTDRVALLPKYFHFEEKEVTNSLGASVVRTDIDRSPLIGIMAAGNSTGVICSELFEIGGHEDLNIGVAKLPGKLTAFGNLVLANDFGALANPDLPDEILKLISEKLNVSVKRGTIAGIKNVGAVAVATNRGIILHPDASEPEVRLAEESLDVSADVGTACGGAKFVGLCMVANSNGVIVGMTTTGPELGRIESALGFI